MATAIRFLLAKPAYRFRSRALTAKSWSYSIYASGCLASAPRKSSPAAAFVPFTKPSFPEHHHAFFDDSDIDSAASITQQAFAKNCSACEETLHMWTEAYGSEAGNMALRALPIRRGLCRRRHRLEDSRKIKRRNISSALSATKPNSPTNSLEFPFPRVESRMRRFWAPPMRRLQLQCSVKFETGPFRSNALPP